MKRRNFIKKAGLSVAASGIVLSGVLPVKSAEEPAAKALLPNRAIPTVDTRFPAEMAPGVFILPDKRIPLIPNIGIIVGTESVLVVDCGLGIEGAENVLRLARELAPGRKVILTVTHAHPEHGSGAQVFKNDAQIYYNTAQLGHQMKSGDTLLKLFREGVLPPAHTHLLDGIKLTSPHKTYDGSEATIDLGGREVRMKTWGTAHSPGDQIIFLPEERILFAGDLLEERMFPIVPFIPPTIGADDIDVVNWEVVLNEIIRLQPRLIVPGHGNLGGTEIPKAVLGYFKEFREILSKVGQKDEEVQAAIRARYPAWENPEYIGLALPYFRLKT